MRIRHLVHVVGLILLALTGALVVTALVALIYGDGDAGAFALTAGISLAVGAAAVATTDVERDLTVREGYAVVALAWLAVGAVGALPFLFTGVLSSPVPALFESISGFTTTGATVFADIEALPHGILFWRNFTQWMGGMGIIVLGLAVLPFLGVGGMQLFQAEVPGPTPSRLQPRITQTAKLLWYVYAGLTAAQAVLWMLGGASAFDAVTHAFTTLSTGGFSPEAESIAAFDSAYLQWVTILFMFLAGVNFALHYRALHSGPRAYWEDAEWRFFGKLLLGAGGLILAAVLAGGHFAGQGFETSLRHSVFQTVSIVTTTGYVTADYEQWAIGAQVVLLLLMFVGGMAGSTGGGMKVVRVQVLVKHMFTEMKKSLRPRAVILTRVGRRVLQEDVLLRIVAFLVLYLMVFAVGTMLLSFLGMDLTTAVGAAAATLGNIGPGLGDVGAVDNYGWMGPTAQGLLTFLMVVGRLELFTVLLLFHPDLWRKSGVRSAG